MVLDDFAPKKELESKYYPRKKYIRLENNMNWYVVKYIGKYQLVPKDVWTVTTKEQLYHEIKWCLH